MSQSTVPNEGAGNLGDQPDTIADILGSGSSGRRNYFGLVWVMAILAVLAVIGAFVAPLFPRSLVYQARHIVDLPKDATVVQVDELQRDGFGDRYGQIYFTLPEPKGPGSRLEEVWVRAGLPSPAAYARYGMKRFAGTPGRTVSRTTSAGGVVTVTAKKLPAASKPAPSKSTGTTTSKPHAVARAKPVTPPPGWSFGAPAYPDLRKKPDQLSYDLWTNRYILKYERSRGRYYYGHFARLPSDPED